MTYHTTNVLNVQLFCGRLFPLQLGIMLVFSSFFSHFLHKNFHIFYFSPQIQIQGSDTFCNSSKMNRNVHKGPYFIFVYLLKYLIYHSFLSSRRKDLLLATSWVCIDPPYFLWYMSFPSKLLLKTRSTS